MKRLIVMLAACVSLSACSVQDPVERFVDISVAEPGGQMLEDFVTPQETALFFAIRPDSDVIDHFTPYLQQFSQAGFDFENDVKPLWDDGNGRIAYASLINSEGQESFYLTFNVNHPDQFGVIADQLLARDGFEESEYKGVSIIRNAEESFYVLLHGNLLFVSDNIDNLRRVIDDGDGPDVNLRHGKEYVRALNKIDEDYWVWLYLNTAEISVLPLAADGVQYRAYYAAERSNNTLFIKGVSLYEDSTVTAAVPYDFYLNADMPAQGLMMYAEKAGLGDWLNSLSDVTEVNYFKRYIGALGFSYEQDILPLFNNNVAFAVYLTPDLVPSVVLLFDTTEAQASAEKIIAKIDGDISAYLRYLKNTPNGSPIIEQMANLFEKDTVMIADHSVNRVVIRARQLLALFDTESRNLDVIPEFINLYYGIVDNRMIIAVYPNFEQVYATDSLVHNEAYRDMRKLLVDSGSLQFFVDAASISSYFTSLDSFLRGTDFERNQLLENYQEYVNESLPFKFLYMVGRDISGFDTFEAILELTE